MWLFLASLFMLFAAAMLGYVLIRVRRGEHTPPLHSLHLPRALWVSTVLVLLVSATLARAVHALRRERQRAFRVYVVMALLLGIGFVAVQGPTLTILLREHKELLHSHAGTGLYGLIFVLILLHALHVVGGIVALGIATGKGLGGAYDHEHYRPVSNTALYWHFLDLVWLVMFGTFTLLG